MYNILSVTIYFYNFIICMTQYTAAYNTKCNIDSFYNISLITFYVYCFCILIDRPLHIISVPITIYTFIIYIMYIILLTSTFFTDECYKTFINKYVYLFINTIFTLLIQTLFFTKCIMVCVNINEHYHYTRYIMIILSYIHFFVTILVYINK